MGIHEVARQLNGTLPDAGRRALNLLLADPQEMSSLTATEVASRLGVHEATVIRLARQLGYSGYRELRIELAKAGETGTALSSAERVRSRDTYTLSALVDDEVAAMQQVANQVSQVEIDQLAERILAARRLMLFGPPYAGAVLNVLERRVRRFGVTAVSLPTSGRLIAEHLTTMTGGDLLLSFVLRRPDARLDRINGVAAAQGATTAVIADEGGYTYQPVPEQILIAPRGPNPNQRSLMVPFLICYALQNALHHLAPERIENSLQRLDDIAKVVGDDEPSH
ncbi:MurR/RpiR family transcriptional regulator [soil metagenome]